MTKHNIDILNAAITISSSAVSAILAYFGFALASETSEQKLESQRYYNKLWQSVKSQPWLKLAKAILLILVKASHNSRRSFRKIPTLTRWSIKCGLVILPCLIIGYVNRLLGCITFLPFFMFRNGR